MNLRYRVGGLLAHKEVDSPRSFLLTNRAGSYYYHNWDSRYGGWFVTDDKEDGRNDTHLFRVLAEVRVPAPKVSEIVHLLHAVEQVRNSLREKFVLPFGERALIYRTSTPQDIDFIFDIRRSNDRRTSGRIYRWVHKGNKTILHFTKKTSADEDDTNGVSEFDFFVVLNKTGKILKRWEDRVYNRDSDNGLVDSVDDSTADSIVYRGVRVWDSQVILTAGTNLNDTLHANNRVEQHLQSLLQMQRDYICTFAQSSLPLCVARAALDSMFGMVKNMQPWTALPITQSYNLDQLISSRALLLSGEHKMVKQLLLRLLRCVMHDGRLPQHAHTDEKIDDSVEWLFLRIHDIGGFLDKAEKKFVIEKCAKYIELLRKRYTKNDLVYMSGKFASVSHQALRCALYGIAFSLTKNIVYKRYEEALRTKIRSLFWNGRVLKSDVDGSKTNGMFMAAYVYPALLNQKEWHTCFSQPVDFSSVHRWERHIQAIVLHRTDSQKFKEKIEKIYTDSENDLLWNGCVGMSSDGHAASAVSAATFIELGIELGK